MSITDGHSCAVQQVSTKHLLDQECPQPSKKSSMLRLLYTLLLITVPGFGTRLESLRKRSAFHVLVILEYPP